jgi:hypothetical protein
MAEIPIERKKKRTIWPWILGIVVVGLLIWMMADNNVVVEDGTALQEREMDHIYGTDRQTQDFRAQRGDGSAEEFVQYVEERNGEISQSHEYTREGLLYLADALDDLYTRIGPAAERSVDTDEIRNRAQQLSEDATSEQHANMIRDAFITAANALQNLQASYFPNLDQQVNNVVETAREIEGRELATEQGEKIDEFFDQAAITVEEMSNEIVQADTRTTEPGLSPVPPVF